MRSLVQQLVGEHLDEIGGRHGPCPCCGTRHHIGESRGAVRVYTSNEGAGRWACSEPACDAHGGADALVFLAWIKLGEAPPPRGAKAWKSSKWRALLREYNELTRPTSPRQKLGRLAQKRESTTTVRAIRGTTKTVQNVNELKLIGTRWPSPKAPADGEAVAMTWNEVIEILDEPVSMPPRGKKDLPIWNFSRFRDHYRDGDHHELSSALLIDYDSNDSLDDDDPKRGNPGLGIADFEACWGGVAAAAHSTPSHSPSSARYRVLLPLDRAVDKDTYRRLGEWAVRFAQDNGAPGLGADRTWLSAVQGFYVPADTYEYDRWLSSSDTLLDVDAALEQLEAWEEEDQKTESLVRTHLPNSPVADAAVVPCGWIATSAGIWKVNPNQDSGNHHVCSSPVLIQQLEVDIHSGKHSIVLAWQSAADGRWHEVRAARERIALARTIPELASYGLPITSINAMAMVEYLANYEHANAATIPKGLVTAKLGWVPSGMEPRGFAYGNEWIGEQPVVLPAPEGGLAQMARALAAAGDANLEQKYLEDACTFPGVLLVVAVSLVTPLLRILGAPAFALSISGPTSRGKTSALRVAMSVWGSANEHEAQSVIRSWDLTTTYAERIAVSLSGLPLALDDTAQAKNPTVVAKLLYSIPSGISRGRANRDASIREKEDGFTVLLSTGETPVLSSSTSGGTRARVLELWHALWGGPSQQTGERIRDILVGLGFNHGHTGRKWIKFILENRSRWPEWRERYQELTRNITTDLVKKHGDVADTGVLVRFSAYLASIVLTFELAVPDMLPADQAHVDEARELLITVPVVEAARRDVLLEAREHIFSVAGSRRADFFDKLGQHTRNYPPNQGWLGRWDKGSDTVYFSVSQLRTTLEASGYEYQATIRGWNERGWLAKTGRGRLDTTVRIDGETNRAVALKVPDELKTVLSASPTSTATTGGHPPAQSRFMPRRVVTK